MARTLGIDPSVGNTGLCLVEDGQPVDWLTLRSNPRDALEQRIEGLAKAVGVQIAGCGAMVVAIEEPYVATWERGKVLAAKARDAMDLAKLTGAIREEAARCGAQIVMVSPADGFRALTGSAKGDKDGHVRFANLRRGNLPRIEEGDHHIADAFAVALAGEARFLFDERQKERDTVGVCDAGM